MGSDTKKRLAHPCPPIHTIHTAQNYHYLPTLYNSSALYLFLKLFFDRFSSSPQKQKKNLPTKPTIFVYFIEKSI